MVWLSLKIQDKPKSGKKAVGAISATADRHQLPLLVVSVPKKIVRLATQRNRIKRLIREAFRKEDHLDVGKMYFFRVMQYPGDIGLKEVQDLMDRLIT